MNNHDNEFAFLDVIPKLASSCITEHTFKKFLPMFIHRGEKEQKDVPLAEWIDLVGSPFGNVEVYERQESDGTFSNLLFVVPPIAYPRDVLDTIPKEVLRVLPRRIETSTLYYEQSPALGEVSLQEGLLNHIKREETQKVDYSLILAWNKIFERYNLPKLPTKLEQKTTNINTGGVNEPSFQRTQISEF